MQKPDISIIMPAHNSEACIADSIRSVQQQDFISWELIIINDRSADRTHQIAQEFARQDSRIRALHLPQSRSGVACARRYGIEQARGQWIAFLDSDDLWLPEKLRIQTQVAASTQAKFLFTASGFLENDGTLLDYVMYVPQRVGYPEILKQNVISASSVLIRRELLEGCFLEKDRGISEDYSAWIHVLRESEPWAVGINQPLLQYRLTRGSVSSNKLKSAYKVLRTYRAAGLNRKETAKNWVQYAVRSLAKYGRIYRARWQQRAE